MVGMFTWRGEGGGGGGEFGKGGGGAWSGEKNDRNVQEA